MPPSILLCSLRNRQAGWSRTSQCASHSVIHQPCCLQPRSRLPPASVQMVRLQEAQGSVCGCAALGPWCHLEISLPTDH